MPDPYPVRLKKPDASVSAKTKMVTLTFPLFPSPAPEWRGLFKHAAYPEDLPKPEFTTEEALEVRVSYDLVEEVVLALQDRVKETNAQFRVEVLDLIRTEDAEKNRLGKEQQRMELNLRQLFESLFPDLPGSKDKDR